VCVCVCKDFLDTILGHFDHVVPDLYTYPVHSKDFLHAKHSELKKK